MRSIKFTLLAVLSYIAMIGAMPIDDGGLAGNASHPKMYVLLQSHVDVLT